MLSDATEVSIDVFNIAGQRVNVLMSEYQEDGQHPVTWDSKDSFGQSVASGIYFYRITDGEYSDTRKMVLLK
ncbi:MAG: T9SS type A sorting domain-containing protein [candidate division Zixibacteria bacterium]|nr:T9SS type A sorting domain-containing protein [candidate division Zixibacteria bacterium]